MRTIFFNDVGRLRSGWRLLIYFLPLVFFTIVWGIILRLIIQLINGFVLKIPYEGYVFEMVFRTGLIVLALVLGYLCARGLEDLPWRSLGLTFHAGWFRDLVIGFALGFVGLAIGVAIAFKGLSFSLNRDGWSAIAVSMISSAVFLFVGALAEEAMFRGYGLQTLSRAKLAWLGVLLTSVPFGIAHLDNPNVIPAVTFTNTAIAGVWLAVAYLRTRSLWLAQGVHWAWNFALGGFFGLPISGLQLVSHPLLRAEDTGPQWLTGGAYGIEGGVACTIAVILVTLFLWRTSLVSATPELLKMTSEENPAATGPVLSLRPVDDQA